MDQKAHHIQDASEKYAVAVMQRLAEDRGVASTRDSDTKFADYRHYCAARDLTDLDFTSGKYAGYKANADRQLPRFVDRLIQKYPVATFDFVDVEAAHRNANKKGDFLLDIQGHDELSVSYKNYRNGATRPQVASGTFNSFVMNFLFEASGVGKWVDPTTGETFAGGAARDSAVERNGWATVVPLLHDLDELNSQMRSRFLDSADFQFLDEVKFDEARKATGAAGAAICYRILEQIPEDQIKRKMLGRIGMDGAEHALIIDNVVCVDSITSPKLQKLIHDVQASDLFYRLNGQNITFEFQSSAGSTILSVNIPFTINKNGAWMSGTPYEGVRSYHNEPYPLAYNERRPRKSRELATSINTYLDLKSTGVFD